MDSKRCITIDEISLIDGSKSHGGVRQCRDTEIITTSGSAKRRKFDHRDQDNVVQSEHQSRSEVDVNSPAYASCDHVLSSPCFEDGLRSDLKAEETSLSGSGGFRTETSSSSEICLDPDKMDTFSIMKKKPAPPPAVTSCPKPPAATSANTPTSAEIDRFFSVMEKKEQKRFSDKYNFDFGNDVPKDGRYQWVRLKP